MAKKTIIITEEQLQEVLEHNLEYLDAADKDFRENGGANEMFIGGKDDVNKKDAEPLPGADRIAQTMGEPDNWFTISRAKSCGGASRLYCSKKRDFVNKMSLLESNSELEGQFFSIDPTTMKALKTAYTSSFSNQNDKGRMSLENAIKNGGISYTEATTLKSRFDNLNPSSKEYQDMGGKALHDFLNRTLQAKTNMSRNSKEFKRDVLGSDNAFIKAGYTKNSGNGKAHTAK